MSGISKRVSDSWVSGDYGIMKTSTDTITTLPVVLYPNDTTATVGLKGNMEQNGTPSPRNPIQPSECGDRTENLFDSSTIEVGGLSPTTGAETTDNTRRRSGFISVEPSTNYGLSREITSSGSFFWVIAYDENKNIVTDATVSEQYSGVLVTGTSLTINQWTFTTTPTTKYIRWYVTVDNSYKNIMLNTGSTALPYEPFGYKIPISSANTTTPVYLGEVETTRQINKLVLTGEETVQTVGGNAPYRISVPGLKIPTLMQVLWKCSHYQAVPSTASWAQYDSLISWNGGDGATLRFRDTSKADVNAFKAFLSSEYSNGTPVTIWYVLAEPETGIINEPLRKIGTYADTISGITIPTIAGANSFDVLTTLKPSEVTANYHGWHTGAVHERDSGQWQ